jgi:hypothetical protein
LAAAAVGLAPGSAGAAGFADTAGCDEQQAFVEGDEAAVRARLPERYEPVRTSAGRPLVFARALRCDAVTLGERSRQAVMASYGVVVESPDGRGCASDAPAAGTVKGDEPPICNWYTLAWLSNDRRVVDWLREGTPSFPAFHVEQLAFDLTAFGAGRAGAAFSFSAASPSPSPFAMEASTRPRPGPLSVRGGYWFDSPQGTVKVALSTDDLTSGDATGVARAGRGSELAALLGAEERPYVPGYSAFAAERWDHASYRKQLYDAPAGPGAGAGDGFAGSCSVQGTVTFEPPASYYRKPLDYAYESAGTCSGTLNGREIADAPVELRQAGRSEGSCASARTTSPGTGSIVFASGELIRYTLDFSSTGTEIDFTLYGERSGQAAGKGSFLTSRTPPDVTARCAGEGASEVPMDMTLTTESQLVSEPPARTHPGTPVRPQLLLAVSPPAVRSGRTSRYAFRVTAAGRAIRGALVRFAGRAIRTDAAGRASLRVTLHRPGAHPARAVKRGFLSARSAVAVRHRR